MFQRTEQIFGSLLSSAWTPLWCPHPVLEFVRGGDQGEDRVTVVARTAIRMIVAGYLYQQPKETIQLPPPHLIVYGALCSVPALGLSLGIQCFKLAGLNVLRALERRQICRRCQFKYLISGVGGWIVGCALIEVSQRLTWHKQRFGLLETLFQRILQRRKPS